MHQKLAQHCKSTILQLTFFFFQRSAGWGVVEMGVSLCKGGRMNGCAPTKNVNDLALSSLHLPPPASGSALLDAHCKDAWETRVQGSGALPEGGTLQGLLQGLCRTRQEWATDVSRPANDHLSCFHLILFSRIPRL